MCNSAGSTTYTSANKLSAGGSAGVVAASTSNISMKISQVLAGEDYTNKFQDIKGFMYSRSIDDYEGSI